MVMIETFIGDFKLTVRQRGRIETLHGDIIKGVTVRNEKSVVVHSVRPLLDGEIEAAKKQLTELPDDPLPQEIQAQEFKENAFLAQPAADIEKMIDEGVRDAGANRVLKVLAGAVRAIAGKLK